MQIITRNTNSTLVFTLGEKQTLIFPYWLFELKLRGTTKFKYFICSDTSEYTASYNKFLVTETSGTEILTSGTINLPDAGEYEYRIFEQTSSSNLQPSNTTSVCETGTLLVVDPTAPTNVVHQISETTYIHHPS
jgi:hypothetical protein